MLCSTYCWVHNNNQKPNSFQIPGCKPPYGTPRAVIAHNNARSVYNSARYWHRAVNSTLLTVRVHPVKALNCTLVMKKRFLVATSGVLSRPRALRHSRCVEGDGSEPQLLLLYAVLYCSMFTPEKLLFGAIIRYSTILYYVSSHQTHTVRTEIWGSSEL